MLKIKRKTIRNIFSVAFLLVSITFLYVSFARSQGFDHFIWLPMVTGENPNTNPVHEGVATYYAATGDGACLFGPSPNDLMVAAIDTQYFANSSLCGAYIDVVGPQGTITVRIVDWCPNCQSSHVDLSQDAFAQIANISQGIVPIIWQIVSPDLPGPIAYHFKDGSNQWWTAVQIRNHRNPVAQFEYHNGSQWINVPRTDYNYFVQTNPGMGVGPYSFRVTDIYGNVLVDSGIPHLEDGSVNGANQFPPGP